jgi:lipoate-protein ligase A
MNPPEWRFIADDGVSAGFGLAADEHLAGCVGAGRSAPVLRLYTYRAHCALVGRFQCVDSELDRDFCAETDIEIGRRPTGGGAILMGPDQLGLAMALPDRRTGREYERARELFARFSRGLVQALDGLGVAAEYRRKNDLEVRGKKIAGLGIFFHPGGGLLFHASLLVDLDVPLMLRVLRTPLEKLSDKAVATVAGRITTVRRELGEPISVDELRGRVRSAYEETLGVSFREDVFAEDELAAIRELERSKYASAGWVDRSPATPDTAGHSRTKTDAGLLEVSLTLAGEVIKAIYITGDFFVDEQALATVERALRWRPAHPEAVRASLVGLEEDGVRLAGLDRDVLAGAIQKARERACQPEARGAGCFVRT